MNKIEEMIEAIEEYIENCKPVPLSSNKIIVEKDAIEELIRELRLKTPDEIKKYQKIISNKDAILADAKDINEKRDAKEAVIEEECDCGCEAVTEEA